MTSRTPEAEIEIDRSQENTRPTFPSETQPIAEPRYSRGTEACAPLLLGEALGIHPCLSVCLSVSPWPLATSRCHGVNVHSKDIVGTQYVHGSPSHLLVDVGSTLPLEQSDLYIYISAYASFVHVHAHAHALAHTHAMLMPIPLDMDVHTHMPMHMHMHARSGVGVRIHA